MYTKDRKQADAVYGRPVSEQLAVICSVIFTEETNYVDQKNGWNAEFL